MFTRALAHHKRNRNDYGVVGAIMGGAVPAVVAGHYAPRWRECEAPVMVLSTMSAIPVCALLGSVVGLAAPIFVPVVAVGLGAYVHAHYMRSDGNLPPRTIVVPMNHQQLAK